MLNRCLILVLLLALGACGDQESKPEPYKYTPGTDLLGVAAADKYINDFVQLGMIDKSQPNWKTALPEPNMIKFDDKKNYFWLLETSKGKIKIKFMPEVAPYHVSNAIYLTRLGFYDGLYFHRVMKNFMMQGGCPLGNGMGSPGYKFEGEFDTRVVHDRKGLLSAANAGPGTDGSQFFITFAPARHLDGKHTIYGEVMEGFPTLTKVEAQATPSQKPKRIITLEKASILEEDK